MKEDILEQLADDYLHSKGYFTRHNIKFLPRPDHPDFKKKQDSNHSDIDVIGIHPKERGSDRVWVVSCKSWQSGFRVKRWLADLKRGAVVSGRPAWKFFRELVVQKWSDALCDMVEEETGSRRFTYVLAVTAVVGHRHEWESHMPFRKALCGNPIRILELSEMIEQIQESATTTLASSDIGRVLQLMKAAKRGKDALLRTVQTQDDD